MSLKQHVTHAHDIVNEAEFQQVAECMEFYKFRAYIQSPQSFDPGQLAALYAEGAEEDRRLAEEGMAEYSAGLVAEMHDRQ